MARLKADNFVYVAPDGRIYDKPGSQADVVGDTTTYTSMSIENPRVWVYGDVAVIVANSTDESTGPRGPVRNRYTFTDVWVRQGGSWKVVNDHVSRITTK
jgi:ketosteroid isomerase-like protein